MPSRSRSCRCARTRPSLAARTQRRCSPRPAIPGHHRPGRHCRVLVCGPRVVFSTYQSSPQVAAAQSDASIPAFDLVIADEAHRCAGRVSSDYSTVLNADLIRASKRLFMTATPRTFTSRVVKKADDEGIEVASMDDHTVFGRSFID